MTHNPHDKRQKYRRWDDDWRNRLGLTWERIAYVLLGVVLTMSGDYLLHRDAVIRDSMTRTQVESLVREHDKLFADRLDQMDRNQKENWEVVFSEIRGLKTDVGKALHRKVPEVVYRIYNPKRPGEP